MGSLGPAAGAETLAGRRLFRRERWVRWVPALTLGGLLGWMVLVPMALIVVSSLRPSGFPLDPGWTLGHYGETYGSPQFWRLVWNTARFAVGSSALALGFGTLIAWLVERTDLPLRGLVRTLVVLPMATPPVLMGIGWVMLLSPRTGFFNHVLQLAFGFSAGPVNVFSMGGMIFVEGLALIPSTFLILSPAFRNMDPSLEEAAFTSGAGLWFAARRVFLPLLAPTILAAAVFLLIVGFLVFDIPGTIGMPVGIFVLSSRVVFLAQNSPTGLPEYGLISAMAMLFLVLGVALAGVYQRFTRLQTRFVTVTGKGWRTRSIHLGRWRWPAFWLIAGYFVLAVAAPLAILVWTSLTPYQAPPSLAMLDKLTLANHADFFANRRAVAATVHSVVVAVGAATVVAGLSLLVAWVVVRGRVPGRRAIDVLSFLPIAIPGTLIAVGLLYVYLTVTVLPIYGSIWILLIAYATTYLSYGSRATQGVMIQLHTDLEDAARTSGAGWLRTLLRVVVPLLLPALAAVWIWVLAHCMRELTTALLLQGPDNATLPVLLFGYWSGGEPNKAAAVGVWLILGLFACIAAWQVAAARSRATVGREGL